ncbi:hypothetical protein KDH_37580 [Dictyobacter sp. S3.2.2.5]|uniref:Uncharacterized protein n=1 Tax=Dictyobacter halimunensis TaxID=3026934 RepID=A0ABQ6FRQ0_9CHLR|nr:hypothetical protein KDH_37580 [Dictyobacter sp. S3.2.2.5]
MDTPRHVIYIAGGVARMRYTTGNIYYVRAPQARDCAEPLTSAMLTGYLV